MIFLFPEEYVLYESIYAVDTGVIAFFRQTGNDPVRLMSLCEYE